MAAGDIKSAKQSVADDGLLDIQPASGEEWVIHNIYYAGAVELYVKDGTSSFKFDADASYGAKLCMAYHCTNTQYISVKNVSGGAALIAYDGIQTK
jgi:hypothetical protein